MFSPVREHTQNLTQYNTAANQRVTNLPIQEVPKFPRRKRKSVIFAENEEVINPGNNNGGGSEHLKPALKKVLLLLFSESHCLSVCRRFVRLHLPFFCF